MIRKSLELSLSYFAAIPISIGARRRSSVWLLQCRVAEAEVQQTLRDELLDCEHLFLVPDLPNLFSNLFVSLMNVFRMSLNCSLSFGSISFTDDADWCCVSDMFL